MQSNTRILACLKLPRKEGLGGGTEVSSARLREGVRDAAALRDGTIDHNNEASLEHDDNGRDFDDG